MITTGLLEKYNIPVARYTSYPTVPWWKEKIDMDAACLSKNSVDYKIHIDGAFGGFIFPISCPDNNINFSVPNVSSGTLDHIRCCRNPTVQAYLD